MKLTFEQAKQLVLLIPEGHPIGTDGQGGVVTTTPPLVTLINALGCSFHMYYERADGTHAGRWRTEMAVAFLREWADALESHGEPK